MASDTLVNLHGVPVLVCSAEGPHLADDDAARDLIGEALHSGARWVSVPVERIADEFFTLRTGLAGEIAQKFVNYRLGLAVVGDITQHIARSPSLRDFVHETNRGRQLWFVATPEEFDERIRDTSTAVGRVG
jgi:uncharacterized protein DUF4180